MLSSFWRRKNGRLVQRLNAAIETSERLSEVYNAPKPPRVVIDTSYVEHKSRQPTIARNFDDDPAAITGTPQHADVQGYVHDAEHNGSDEAVGFERDDESANGEALAGDVALLKEAVEQLELAEQREAEALQELDTMRRRTEELEAAVATEREARRTAEAASDEAKAAAASAAGELAALRSSLPAPERSAPAEAEARARLEAKLMLEQAARRKAEAQRDQASQALTEAHDEIEVLRKNIATDAAARQTDNAESSSQSDVLEEVAALRLQNEELAAEAAKAREALSRAESDVKAARRATEAARKEAAALREATVKAGEVENELVASKSREADACAKAQRLDSRIEELVAQISDIERERTAEQQAARKQVAESTAQLEAMRLASEHLAEERAHKDADFNNRNEMLLKDVETLRGQLAGLEAAAAKERETARKAAAKASDEIAALRAAAKEQAENKARESGQAEQHTTEALAQVETLRKQLAKAEENRDAERKAAARAAADAATEIESLRLAAQEVATSQLKTAAEENATIEMLRGKLEALRQRADELETAFTAAEAARLSAEFDRENARKEADEAEARLAALHNQPPVQSSSQGFTLSEPPVFRTTAAVSDVASPYARRKTMDAEPTPSDRTSPLLAEAAADVPASEPPSGYEDASTSGEPSSDAQRQTWEVETATLRDDDEVATQHIANMPPPLPQTSESASVDTRPAHAPADAGDGLHPNALPDSLADADEAERRGREKRVPSRMAVTLWTEAWGQPLSCFLIDKSSRGAKIEMKPDRIFGGNNRINVGDRLTLTFYYAQERTSVFCDVMWMDGNFLGVKYYGQFHTEINKPRPAQRGRFGAAK